MSLTLLNYLKSWMNVSDFATRETNESRVRADLQYFPDAIREYINGTLIPGIESELKNLTVGAIPDGSISADKLNAEAGAALIGKVEVINLSSAGWDDAKCYAVSNENIKDANTVVDMFIAPGASDAQRTALREADIVCQSQTAHGMTLLAKGIKPAIDTQVMLFFRQDIAAGNKNTQPRLINHIAPPGQKYVVWNGIGSEPAVINGAILLKVTG